MRVATWNVNGLRSRFDFVLHWLRERQPDLVGLQETKVEDQKFPRMELEAEGYQILAHGQKGWNGVAILAREPQTLVHEGLPGQKDMGARLLAARVKDLTFATVYCPNGKSVEHDDYARKLAWFDSLRELLAADHRPEDPLVVGGDFNVCPTPLDTWREDPANIFHTKEERERIAALHQWGLGDTFRHLHPETQAFSWWDYRGGSFHRNQGLRIDFLLATPPVLERVESIYVDREYRKKKDGLTASDHAPIIMELR